MSRDASPSASSLRIARGLLTRETTGPRESAPETVAAALQRTCLRVSENLRDAMGEGGCSALLARALARAEADHPLLNDVRGLEEGRIQLGGLAARVDAHGVAAVTAAIEGLLAALVEILGRLIGEDMAVRLMDHDPPRPDTVAGGQAS